MPLLGDVMFKCGFGNPPLLTKKKKKKKTEAKQKKKYYQKRKCRGKKKGMQFTVFIRDTFYLVAAQLNCNVTSQIVKAVTSIRARERKEKKEQYTIYARRRELLIEMLSYQGATIYNNIGYTRPQ